LTLCSVSLIFSILLESKSSKKRTAAEADLPEIDVIAIKKLKNKDETIGMIFNSYNLYRRRVKG